MNLVITPREDEVMTEVTRRFYVSGAPDIRHWYGGNSPTMCPESVTLVWRYWPAGRDDGGNIGPIFDLDVSVYGRSKNRDGSLRKGNKQEIHLPRGHRPEWLTELIARYDQHGNPVR